ncbi:nucleoside deaminase [Pseudonocardia xishanensis]|uniref:CMP/dCMP-type deaminase domain-containing protein n=1 Tax=Pseudonocardia xishanensis TaxID=630995 RepID=A0ABP8RZV3_9PSEU
MDEHVRRAVELAREAATEGNRPFGAVLLGPDGAVLAEGRNRVTSTGDLRAHAELDALENARTAGLSGAGGTMVASGEPCPMCSAGMVWAGLARIVFAAAEPDFSPILGEGPQFTLRCADVVAAASVEIAVEGPVGGEPALEVFREYRG